MTEPEFKSRTIYFGKDVYQTDNCMDKMRLYGRSLLRGVFMFNDLNLADDPWDYSKLKPRK